MTILLSAVMVVSMAFSITACDKKEVSENIDPENTVVLKDNEIVGTGKTSFPLTIVDEEGNSIKITVKTDKEFLGDALIEAHLIAGENSEHGLYVKTVNGITVDYDKDQKYWALYIDGEYATKGIDAIKVKEETKYTLKVE